MLKWPKWMPKPLQESFSMQPEDRRISSSTVGPAFSKGFGGDVCIAEISLALNQLQQEWFEQFERDVLTQGAKWFLFPVWYSGDVFYEKCRFKTRPKTSSINGFHSTVSFSVYVEKRSELIQECLIKLLFCWDPCFFFALADKISSLFSSLSEITEAGVLDSLSGLRA